MKKSIGILTELIDQLKLSVKTQTIRLVKFNPEHNFDFHSQFKNFNPTLHNYSNYSAL